MDDIVRIVLVVLLVAAIVVVVFMNVVEHRKLVRELAEVSRDIREMAVSSVIKNIEDAGISGPPEGMRKAAEELLDKGTVDTVELGLGQREARLRARMDNMKEVLRLVDSEEDFYINGPLSRYIGRLVNDEEPGAKPWEDDGE